MSTAYIVPPELLATSPPAGEWHATTFPADQTRSLVIVQWDNPNAQTDFESLPGVLFLGEPWEPLPAEAAPLLTSLQNLTTIDAAGAVIATPATDLPTAPDTVATALRKLSWPGARMLR